MLENLLPLIDNTNLPARRLLKNYLLILGKLNQPILSKFKDKVTTDPLLLQAYKLAKSGVDPNVLLKSEPEIIRQKYYSTEYHLFDDLSNGSI